MFTSLLLDVLNVFNGSFEDFGHACVHVFWVVAFNKVRIPAVAAEELLEFFVFNTCQKGRVTDLVAVKVKNRQYCAVSFRVQELVRVPSSGKWASFGFAVTNNTSSDEARVVKDRTKCVAQ